MRKALDDNLNLEQLLSRSKQLEGNIMVRIYYDPDTYLFYVCFVDEMAFFLPPTSSFICQSRAENVRLAIEMWIANAVRMSTKPVEL